MPWHLPADLAHFKRLTTGGVILMGRKTFESIGSRPLPRRTNLVLTRDRAWSAPGVEAVPSLEVAASRAPETLYVIGGSQVYAQALPAATRIEWTRIDAEPEGDTWFRPDLAGFERVQAQHHPADSRNAHSMTFESWKRV